jgi:hypothetical protein
LWISAISSKASCRICDVVGRTFPRAIGLNAPFRRRFPCIAVVDAPLLLRALEIYEVNRLDFAEAYLFASAEATGVGKTKSRRSRGLSPPDRLERDRARRRTLECKLARGSREIAVTEDSNRTAAGL